MRALYAAKLGGDTPLANLEYGQRPTPQPGPGEVRVNVRAATLNHHDYWTLRGVVGYPITPPRILGCDAAGVVDAYGGQPPEGAPPVGAEVAVYSVRSCGQCRGCLTGDFMLCRTFTMLSDGDREGSFAEYVIVPASAVLPKPKNLSFAQTAALGVTYLTAYRMLFTKAHLRPGDTALVQGAGGGLATAAIQLAGGAGIRVIASSRDEAKLDFAVKLGATDGVLAGKEAAKAIVKLTGGDGVDAVMESVGEPTWGTSMRAVRQGGIVVVAGATGGPNPPADLSRVFWRQITVAGSSMGTPSEFAALVRFVERAGIKPAIDQEYPLDQGIKAFERMAAGEVQGKLSLSV
ncbi:MAG TPA: zinc-binding dehydrogenase [Candidatus Eremiobacteraceae bacterium]|nr:zinc-binding dehydrogenase [Candidatus Eremiobacteraceae bacterium]